MSGLIQVLWQLKETQQDARVGKDALILIG